MTIQQWKEELTKLAKEYGLTFDDVFFDGDDRILENIAIQYTPEHYMNEHAKECDLYKISEIQNFGYWH